MSNNIENNVPNLSSPSEPINKVKQRRKKLKKGERLIPPPDGQKRCIKCNRCYDVIDFLRKKDVNKKDEDKKYSNICCLCREQINQCSKGYYKDPNREKPVIIKQYCEICEIYMINLDKHNTCESHKLICRKINEAVENGLKK